MTATGTFFCDIYLVKRSTAEKNVPSRLLILHEWILQLQNTSNTSQTNRSQKQQQSQY